MKMRLVISLFLGLFVTPAMAFNNKYVCPILPKNAGISWQEQHGIDTHHCTAIRASDKKKLFNVDLGIHGWQGSAPENARKYKGVIAGHAVLWSFYIQPESGKAEWESIFTIPFTDRQRKRELSVLVSVPQNSKPDAREALRLLSKMQLVFPRIGP